jgi:hypothetical protein
MNCFWGFLLSLLLFSVAQAAEERATRRALAPELLPVGTLRMLDKPWELVQPGTDPSNSSTSGFSDRCLFSNSVSGDLLCFAIRHEHITASLGFEYFAGMAYESQFDLAEHPSSNLRSKSASTLRVNRVRLDDGMIPKARAAEPNAGEFSFILEEKGMPNLLAHGYVVQHRDLLLYVQHTSAKVITPELAEESMQRWLASLSPGK